MHTDLADLWAAFNRTDRFYPDEGGVVAWIGRAAAAHRDRPAVHTAEQTLSFGELDRKSDLVAAALAQAGVAPGAIVAVSSTRSVHPYPALLGVLKAGCGYLPVDMADPEERLRFILADAGAVAFLASRAELSARPWIADVLSGGVIALDDVRGDGPVPQPPRDPERVCYVIYTSGTTGVPKGVRISETNLLNLTHWFISSHELTAIDRVAQTAPLTFDPSVQQIFPAWVTGACLVPVPDRELYDPFALMKWLASERISVIDVVTSQWHHWRSAAEQMPELRRLPELRWVVVGGETIYYHESKQWYDVVESPALLRNIYGPTEATVDVSEIVIDPAVKSGQVSIGVPLPNYRLYVVADGCLCPLGTAGELLIAGLGVAPGYQSPDATARAFGEVMLADGWTERVYHSGDLARMVRDPSGREVLEFIGRMDKQLKIRGFRIEPGEIEAVVRSIAGVRDAAVQLRPGGREQLVCFFAAGESVREALVQAQLSKRLAAHQVPNLYLRMDELPVTRSGKLDRAALDDALGDAMRRREPPGATPYTDTEKLVAEAWSEVLDLGPIGVDESFFALGGTSLLLLDLIRAMRSRGLSVDPADVFESPTIREVAAVCGRLGPRQPASSS